MICNPVGKDTVHLCVCISSFPNAISILLFFKRVGWKWNQTKQICFPGFCVSQLSSPSARIHSGPRNIWIHAALHLFLPACDVFYACVCGAPIVCDFPGVVRKRVCGLICVKLLILLLTCGLCVSIDAWSVLIRLRYKWSQPIGESKYLSCKISPLSYIVCVWSQVGVLPSVFNMHTISRTINWLRHTTLNTSSLSIAVSPFQHCLLS